MREVEAEAGGAGSGQTMKGFECQIKRPSSISRVERRLG